MKGSQNDPEIPTVTLLGVRGNKKLKLNSKETVRAMPLRRDLLPLITSVVVLGDFARVDTMTGSFINRALYSADCACKPFRRTRQALGYRALGSDVPGGRCNGCASHH